MLTSNSSTIIPIKPVRVSAMVESLCPYSRSWMRFGLAPAIEQIGHLVEFELIPFGNLNKETGNCQHGSRECRYNAVMACELALNGSLFQTSLSSAKFNVCVMDECKAANAHPAEDDDACWKRCLSEDIFQAKRQFEAIKTCADREDYKEVMRQRTGPHTFVPWVTVTSIEKTERPERIDFQSALCEIFLKDQVKTDAALAKYCSNKIEFEVEIVRSENPLRM
eukprot:GDKJ01048434.1.p1 GENE.GDKJ01048434.1~~GDKJ01048434.1.p1  ORF type:complete len:223 (+),score=51.26 GDKJ01048434.1:57-725(+)